MREVVGARISAGCLEGANLAPKAVLQVRQALVQIFQMASVVHIFTWGPLIMVLLNAKMIVVLLLLLVVQIVNCKVRVVLELFTQLLQAVQVILPVATKTALVLPVQLVRIKMKPVKLNVKIVLQVLHQVK